MTTLTYRFRMRYGTAAQWASVNEVLLPSELGNETDTGRLKIGDGITAWNSLPYFATTDLATIWANL